MSAGFDAANELEAHLNEERLRTLLERAEEVAKIGHYRDDLVSGDLYWSRGLYAIAGVDESVPTKELPNLDTPIFSPEQAQRFFAQRDAAAAAGVSYSCQATLRRPDGEERVIYNHAIPEFDPTGRVRAFFGVVQDVTEEQAREKTLHDLTREYERAERLARMFHAYEDFSGDTINVSPMFYEIFGLEPGSGAIPLEALHGAYESEQARVQGRARREAFKRAGEPYSAEVNVVRANDAQHRVLALAAEPEVAADGRVVGQFAIVRDITELRRAERELKRTNRLFDRAQRLSRVGHFYDDFVANLFHPSDSMFEIWGVEKPAEPVTLEEFSALVHGADTAQIARVMAIQEKMRTDPRPFLTEITLKRPSDGETRHIRIESESDVDESGHVVGSFGIIQDVTELRQAEHELRQTNRLLYRAERLSNVGYCYDDYVAGGFTASDTWFEITGVPRPSHPITLLEFCQALFGADQEQIARVFAVQRAMKHQPHTYFVEIVITRPIDGERRHLLLEAEPDFDDEGRCVGSFAVIQDVTELRRTERELRQTNRLFYRAQRLSGIGHFYDDFTTGKLTSSDSLYDIYGIEKPLHPITLREFAAIAHQGKPEDIAGVMHLQERMKREPFTSLNEFTIERPNDGETRHLRIETEPDLDRKGRVLGAFGVLQDVTELRHAERELRRREAFLEAAQKAALVAPYRLEVSTERFTGSLLIREFFGWTGEAPPFVPLQEVYDRMATEADVERASTALAEATAKGEAYSFEYSIRRQSDGALRHVRTRAEPELGPSGEVVAFLGVLQDVTAEVEARREREQLAHRIERAQRIETLGFFAGGLAHEVRNVVQPLPLIAKRLRRLLENGETDKVRAGLDSLELASERALTSVRGMLAYIGSERELIEPQSLGAFMEDAERFLRAAMRARLRFTVEPDARAAVLSLGRTGFLQVALNLAQNAVEAGGENVTITFSARVDDEPEPFPGSDLRNQRHVTLCVEDDGPGIPEAALPRIFEPFFSSKPDMDGSGLGLALVQSMVSRWGGEIAASSAPGGGARFIITLPCVYEGEVPTHA